MFRINLRMRGREEFDNVVIYGKRLSNPYSCNREERSKIHNNELFNLLNDLEPICWRIQATVFLVTLITSGKPQTEVITHNE